MSAVIIISSFVIIFLKGSVFFETRYSEISFPISLSGKSSLILKIDNDKISRPFILNKNLFIVKDNAIIKLD